VPTSYLDDETPVVQFDPNVEISPFFLFRRLRDGRAPMLVDVRPASGRLTLVGAIRPPETDWLPEADAEVVLFDDDGSLAVTLARQWQAAGCERVKALFGGLELWEFSLDPEVVGESTFLIAGPDP
jgi:hypothetical protein